MGATSKQHTNLKCIFWRPATTTTTEPFATHVPLSVTGWRLTEARYSQTVQRDAWLGQIPNFSAQLVLTAGARAPVRGFIFTYELVRAAYLAVIALAVEFTP